jgi:hypothetical protein
MSSCCGFRFSELLCCVLPRLVVPSIVFPILSGCWLVQVQRSVCRCRSSMHMPGPSVAAHGPHPAPRNNHHPPSAVYHRNSRVSRDVSAFPSGLARAVPRLSFPWPRKPRTAPDPSMHMHVIGGLRASCSPVRLSFRFLLNKKSLWVVETGDPGCCQWPHHIYRHVHAARLAGKATQHDLTPPLLASTPSVSFYLSLDSVKLHCPATNKKKRREYYTCI